MCWIRKKKQPEKNPQTPISLGLRYCSERTVKERWTQIELIVQKLIEREEDE